MTSRVILLSLIACLTVGCTRTVSIEDDSVSFGNIETSFPLKGTTFNRVRLRGSGVGGDFSQSLDSDERIIIDNDIVSGPTEVSGDIDLIYFSLAVGWDRGNENFAKGDLGTSLYLGLAHTSYDLTLRDGNEIFRDGNDTTEFYFQYGVYMGLSDALDFRLTWALSAGRELTGISEIDLKLEYQMLQHLTLAGGYRWFNYDYNNIDDDDSNIEVNFRGPFISIQLPF